MSSATAKMPLPEYDGLSRASHYIGREISKSQDLAIVLIYIHGIERLCATLGHARAGELLDDFQTRLASLGRRKTAVERLSDRKFAVVLNGLRNAGHVRLAAQKIERVMQETFDGAEDQSLSKLTMGIVNSPEHGDDANELLRCAEIAVLDGRRNNETICFYAPESADELILDWNLERRLDDAMRTGDLEVHYQPKIDLRNDKIVGAEALMRWYEPEIGQVSPDVFIEVAESTGQIIDLTHFAVQRVCRQASEWLAAIGDLNIAINITPSIILDTEIIDVLKNATSIWGIEPGALTLEVTENALMADRKMSHQVLTGIRKFGSRVSIDDFGTGYSSLSYLKEIPADELKIDRTFVMGMLSDQGDYKIVKHTIEIAKSFGLSVVAEGVETAEMLDELKKLGCDYAQGYFVCKPVPADEFERFLK
ncbi:MAG: EAL domain-containing protein [Gammaproteobacteria bacterium]|nr:EAL domain-containing protein [Gammaproteobacteria bacterium]MDH3375242.1 EAL domain-containing protein [Gammaproteobacteria bacterium]MDH3552023.1 EAL domain-containing protein [Gammaproteobacteria bacterium]